MGSSYLKRMQVIRSIFFLLTVSFASWCFAEESTAEYAEEELVWPAPPQSPKIRYLQSFSTSDDVAAEKGFFGKIIEFIIGPDDIVDLVKPMGVAVSSTGKLYVADAAGKRIHIFDKPGQEYDSIEGVSGVRFGLPIEITIDDEDSIYIADGLQRKVFKFTHEGEFVRSFSDNSLQRPTGVAVDPVRQLLFVVDTPAHNVKVFSLKDGLLKGVIGKRGVDDGTFNFPGFAATDASGALYVTDSMNKKIRVFGADQKYRRSIGKPGDGSGSFSSPKGVAVDSDGHVYVADVAFDNIQIFDKEGQLLLTFGTSGQRPGEFWMPAGLFIDKSDRIYVADSYNKRIQVFQYLGTGSDSE
jgi:DNA-binding beta-propeller fold protein YncE